MSRLSLSPALWACLLLAAPIVAQESSAPPMPVTTPESIIQDGPTEPEITLDELIRRALENNPQPAIARANLEAARRRAESLKSLPNPVLQLTPGFIGNQEARDEEIILSQPLDLFGQRKAQRRVREAETQRTELESDLVSRVLIVEVKNAAANLFAAQEAERLGVAQVEVAQAFHDAAKRRAELGDVPPVQAQRAELELLRIQNELTNAQTERLLQRAVLNQLIGQAPETPLRVSLPLDAAHVDLLHVPGASLTVQNGGTLSAQSLPTTPQNGEAIASNTIFTQRGAALSAVVNRPDILSAQATLEARRAQVDAIGKQRLPQVELQARRSSVFGEDGSYALRAVITAPVFDFGAIKNEKRAAQAEVKAQESQIALLNSQAAAQVEQALIRLNQQRETMARYQNGIVPQTLDLLRKTQIGFAEGASSYLEVLEAQRTLRSVQAEYLQALVGVRLGETQLESATSAGSMSSTPQGGR